MRCVLIQDRRGVVWDLLLYVPTVVVLALLALKLWYGDNRGASYILFFMASFFLIAGANRILKTRLMWLPSAPEALEIDKTEVRLELRNGDHVSLVKDLRFYPDTQGHSFGLSGKDVLGRSLQYVFHRGQFQSGEMYRKVTSALEAYK